MLTEEREKLAAEFIDRKTINALNTFIMNDTLAECMEQAAVIVKIFGATDTSFLQIDAEKEKRLTQSFKNNLKLLIEKTWVEKSDIELKERVLYQAEQFCTQDNRTWKSVYAPFLDMISNAVYLMFGMQPRSDQFITWAFRIDPEFGIFWWYISGLPHEALWSEEKCRLAIKVGMYFLAKY